MPGPLQVIAVSFAPGADFEGRVLAEVDRLQGRGVLRVLDVLFLAKDEDGAIEQLVVGDDEDFGPLLASVVRLDEADLVSPSAVDGLSGFDSADAWALAESLRPGSALAFLLIEHGWAQPLFDAIADTGGVVVGEGLLTSEAGLLVGAHVAAMEEAAEVIAAAQAAEVDATLLAIAAETRASQAMAASEAVRAAAAAHAVRSLIRAGVVAEAAAHEAVEEALGAVGSIVAAADEAAARAVADDVREGSAARRRQGGGRGSGRHRQGRIDQPGRGTGPALLAHPLVVRGHRRQTGDLPVGGQGTSRACLQEARGSQPRRGSQPGPRPRDHRLTDYIRSNGRGVNRGAGVVPSLLSTLPLARPGPGRFRAGR